jgi:hypothetical protein
MVNIPASTSAEDFISMEQTELSDGTNKEIRKNKRRASTILLVCCSLMVLVASWNLPGDRLE